MIAQQRIQRRLQHQLPQQERTVQQAQLGQWLADFDIEDRCRSDALDP
jgi:hypothetical protein